MLSGMYLLVSALASDLHFWASMEPVKLLLSRHSLVMLFLLVVKFILEVMNLKTHWVLTTV